MKPIDRRPDFSKTPVVFHNFSESFKDSSKGKLFFFKVDGKAVAYVVGKEGWRSKDPVDKETADRAATFIARHGVDYMGKTTQIEIDKLVEGK